jgi:LDH2 family malate/lactate/ureidoglycolate dehydrogenase
LQQQIAAMPAYITASPPQCADEPVLISRRPERLTRSERLKNGVPVDEEAWPELILAARVNLPAEMSGPTPGDPLTAWV